MLKPLRDWIVIALEKVEEKVGLIYKPATVNEQFMPGKVLAVGSGFLADNGQIVPLEVKEGDMVLVNKQLAIEIKHNNETYYLVREGQIMSVIT
jgi:chaperonin GroES